MKISIIIPAYNVEKYIARCINSISNQTINDLEIIIVNDHSSDNTANVIQELASKDSRIIFINKEINEGPALAREAGYKIAKGDFIVFCDGDDFLPENALEKMYNNITKTAADILVGNMLYIPLEQKPIELKSQLLYGETPHDAFRSILLGEMAMSLCAKMFNRQLFDKHSYNNFQNFIFGEDAALLYRLINNSSKITHISSQVYCYVQNSKSTTNTHITTKRVESMILANQILYNVTKKYTDLNLLVNRFIIDGIIGTIYEGYPYKDMKNILKKYNMEKLLKVKTQIKFYSLNEILKNILRIKYRALKSFFIHKSLVIIL